MTAPLQIHWLHDGATADESELRSQIGGKAESLKRMSRNGISIPRGFVLPTGVCRYYFEHDRQLPDAFWSEIAAAAERLQDSCTTAKAIAPIDFRVAVRSGAAVSMPGTMQTILDCPVIPSSEETSPLRQAIEAVLDSWESDAARAYREHWGLQQLEGTAVIIQEMIDTTAAGVLFTRDPDALDNPTMIVEAVLGRGDGLVSGSTPACRWRVGRQTLGIEADRSHAPIGTPERSPLTDPELQELARQSLIVEELFGEPLDIEWGSAAGTWVFFQARPIQQRCSERGSAEPSPADIEQAHWRELRGRGETIWVRHNLTESVSCPTPLTWSILQPFMTGTGGWGHLYRRLGFAPSRVACERGFLALIAGQVYASPKLLPEMFCSDFPFGFDSEALRLDASTIERPPQRFDLERIGPWFLLRSPFIAWRLWRATRRVEHLARAADEVFERATLPAYHDYIEREKAIDLERLSIAELVDRLRERVYTILDEFAARLFLPGTLGMMLFQRLEAGLEPLLGKKTTAQFAASHLMRLDVPIVRRHVEALCDLTDGILSLDEFLKEFGHRANDDLELLEPRWIEAPNRIPTVTHTQRPQQESNDTAPITLREATHELRERLKREGAASLAGPLEKWLERSSVLLPLREVAKDELLKGYALIREVVEELARRDHFGPDTYFLTIAELVGLAQSGATVHDPMLRERAIRRRRHWKWCRQQTLPAFIDLETFDLANQPHERDDSVDQFQATPLASGSGCGVAVHAGEVTSRPEDSPEYVLVTRRLSPAQLPQFQRARAIIADQANRLSHGVILARSLGIPVVTLPEASDRIPEGAFLEVDGTTGVIKVSAGRSLSP